jgi:hypothetical protein
MTWLIGANAVLLRARRMGKRGLSCPWKDLTNLERSELLALAVIALTFGLVALTAPT